MRRYMAEAIGTFGIVLSGCGAALVGGARLGDAGVALAFGLALAAMLFAAGPISGGHFNPAVTLAMALSGRLPGRDVVPYIAAQIGGGVAGAGAVIGMANGRPGGAPHAAEAIANGFGRHSPGFYGLTSALLAEITLTALFVFVFVSVSVSLAPRPVHRATEPHARLSLSTHSPHPSSSASLPLAAGAAYALIHLVGLPVTRLAANPARALGPALLAGGAALEQVWLFIAAPIAGGLLAALAHRALRGPRTAPAVDAAPSAPPSSAG